MGPSIDSLLISSRRPLRVICRLSRRMHLRHTVFVSSVQKCCYGRRRHEGPLTSPAFFHTLAARQDSPPLTMRETQGVWFAQEHGLTFNWFNLGRPRVLRGDCRLICSLCLDEFNYRSVEPSYAAYALSEIWGGIYLGSLSICKRACTCARAHVCVCVCVYLQ